MDVVEDNMDNNTSFVAESILDHRIIKKPWRSITTEIDEHGKETTKVRIDLKSHIHIQVAWKNDKVTWFAANSMKEQNPFVFLPYVLKRNLSTHSHFKWVLAYDKD